jgi:hypothetical protein
MARSISRWQSQEVAVRTPQQRALAIRQPQQRGMAVYQSPLANILPALSFGKQLERRSNEFCSSFRHGREMVRYAREHRDKLLPLFPNANAAALILADAMRDQPDRQTTSAMVGTMLAAFGAKADKDVLAGMLDMLEGGDEIAGMLDDDQEIAQWRLPLRISSAGLALACRSLIASVKFTPKPAELREACRKAERQLKWAMEAAEQLVDFVRRCDAVLLEFDHDEWRRPYLVPQCRPILQRMLELHEICGDGSNAWQEAKWNDDDQRIHPFAELVKAEQAKLALPAPEAEATPMREAACETKPAKRTRKAKRTENADA